MIDTFIARGWRVTVKRVYWIWQRDWLKVPVKPNAARLSRYLRPVLGNFPSSPELCIARCMPEPLFSIGQSVGPFRMEVFCRQSVEKWSACCRL